MIEINKYIKKMSSDFKICFKGLYGLTDFNYIVIFTYKTGDGKLALTHEVFHSYDDAKWAYKRRTDRLDYHSQADYYKSINYFYTLLIKYKIIADIYFK